MHKAFFHSARLLLAVFSVLVLMGCKKKITLVIKTGVNPFKTFIDGETADAYTLFKKASQDFVKRYTDADVEVSLSQYESARRGEEVDGCFGTPLSPDVLFASQFNLSAYVHEGRLVPLESILDGAMRRDLTDSCLEGCIVGGRTYMIPFITFQNVMCFNKELFKKAGLERYCRTDEVQNWMLSEWDEVLSTLKAALPDTAYPMMMYAADEQGDAHIMTLLRSRGCNFFDDDGNVCLETSEGIAALNWLRRCNEAGYFPPHPERLVILDNYELFVSGQLAIYIVNQTIQQYFDKEGIDCGYVNLPSVDGEGFTTSFDMSFAVVDNGDENKLKAAKAFVSHIYKSPFLEYSAAGGNPASRRVATKYAAYLTDVSRYVNNKAHHVNFSNNSPNWIGVRAVFYKHIQDLFATDKSTMQIAQEIDRDCNEAIGEGRKESHPHD